MSAASHPHLFLSQERYVVALERQRDRIAKGLKLEAIDSDVPGNRFVHVSWGLCSIERAAWPDAHDHIWPDQFRKQGRVAPKYRTDAQRCPLQSGGYPFGCYHSCRAFKRELGPESAGKVVNLYDAAIRRATGGAA